MDHAINKLHTIREEALEDRWINRVYPLFKLIFTCFYIGILTSVSREDLDILLSLGIYLLILFVAGDLSLKECIARLWIALPFVCMMGILNIFLEQEVQFYLGKLPVTTGMLDFVSLLIKGVESLLAVYLLVVTTTIEKICASLQRIHCPSILVMLFLLIYRYIGLLLAETEKMLQAYHLRAPGQKGIAIHVWGSFVGRLLLRTYDRAEQINESMKLRGFQGKFLYGERMQVFWSDWLFLGMFTGLILVLRYIPVFVLVGNLFA